MSSKFSSNLYQPNGIKGLEEVGSIWQQNEKQRKENKKLNRIGKRTITNFNRNLSRLNKQVDKELLTIKKNLKEPSLKLTA